MSSYKSIAKATGLIGGVQIIQMIFALLRNKALAIIVGASGFGLWGMFNSYMEMISQLTLLGLDQGGVRLISESEGDKEKVSIIYFLILFIIISVSLLFVFLSYYASHFISNYIFNSSQYSFDVILISLGVLFLGLYKAQGAVLIGLGKVDLFAKSQIYGSVFGSLIAVSLVYLFNKSAIAIYVIAVPCIAAISTGFYIRNLKISIFNTSFKDARSEFWSLISIGAAFSFSGIISTIMTYMSRAYIGDNFDLETVGVYQASWTISNLYIGMLLNAMGVDLLPRLTRVQYDSESMSRLVNEQMELGVLIGSVGVIAVLVFSPILLSLLYSKEFVVGTNIIRWHVLGVSLRLLAFPLSYAVMAKRKSFLYAFIQFVFWVTEYILLVLFTRFYGFDGLGVNYLIGYALYFIMVFIVGKKYFGFKVSPLLVRILVFSYLSIAVVFLITVFIPVKYGFVVGAVVLGLQLILVNRRLNNDMNINVMACLNDRLKRVRGL